MGLDIDLQGCSIRPLPTGPERMPHSRKQYQLACVTFSKNMWHALSTHTHTHTHTHTNLVPTLQHPALRAMVLMQGKRGRGSTSAASGDRKGEP